MLKKIVKKITHKKTALDAYRFNIDEVSDRVIAGWAHKVGEGNYAASIEIRNNNVILYSIKANLPRKDLQAAAIGSGQYGFVILPSALKLEDDIDSIDIFIDGLKANVNSLPLVLSANIESNAKPKHEFAGEISGFSDSVHKEIARLSSQINEQGNNTMQVAIENIACLSVRIEVIENILTKHFAGK
jgi:hypothetical protein